LAGTDATHAEHIETIKSRMYVGLQNGCHFVPGELGMGLVEGYDNMGYPMSKPHLRAELEADLKRICEGTRDPKVVLAEQLVKYKEVFRMSLQQVECSVVANAFLFVCTHFSGIFHASKMDLFTCSADCTTSTKLS
jgi:DNA topoisomerase-3